MRNPYLQVAGTYGDRIFSSWAVAAICLAMLLLLVVALGTLVFAPGAAAASHNDAFLMMLLAPLTFLSGLVLIHLKEQLAHPRMHLMPGARQAHAAVAGAILALLFLLVPALLLSRHLPVLGTTTIIACLMAWTSWWVLTLSAIITWTGMLAWFALFSPYGQGVLQAAARGEHPLLLAVLLAGAILVFLAAGVRWLRLNEEMPEYYRVMRGYQWSLKQPAMDDPRAWRANPQNRLSWAIGPTQRQLDYLLQHRPGGLWTRITRWRAGTTMGRGLVMFALWVTGYNLAMVYLGIWRQADFVRMTTPWLAIFPMAVSFHTIFRHWRVLGYESLRPVGRAQFFRELGLAMGVNLALAWVAVTAGALLSIAIVAPQQLTLHAVALLVAVSGCSQVLMFAVVLWLMRSRSLLLAILGLLLGGVLPVLLSVAVWEPQLAPSAPHLLLIAAALVPAGLLILWDAYRRWLTTDLD